MHEARCPLQDPDNLLNGEAQGYAAAQIFYDVFKVRDNSLISEQHVLVLRKAPCMHHGAISRTAGTWGACSLSGCEGLHAISSLSVLVYKHGSRG